MELTRFDDVAAFSEQAEPFLLAREAEHNLMLGICSTLLARRDMPEGAAYLALVQEGGAPVAAAILTPPRKLVLSRVTADELASQAMALVARDAQRVFGDHLPGAMGSELVSRVFADEWQRLTGQPYHLGLRERIYQLSSVLPVTGVAGQLRRAGPADRELLVNWFVDFNREVFGGREPVDASRVVDEALASSPQGRGLCLWDDGEPVAMAGYGGVTPNGIRIGPVYTPPARRGKGYASACTAALSQQLLESGRRFCFLFTDLSNPTSNHIYQSIGYRPVGDVNVYEFGQSPL